MKRLSVVFLVLFSIFCLSCDFSAGSTPEKAKINEDGTITVRFYLGLPSFERSVIIPSKDITISNLGTELGVDKFIVYIDREDTANAKTELKDYSNTGVLDIDLLPGNHTIQIEAAKNDDTVVLKSDNQTVTISTSTPSYNLSLKPYTDTAQNGSVSIKVRFPLLSSGESDRTFYIKAEIDDGVSRSIDDDSKKSVTLKSTNTDMKEFKIKNVIPGTHHINFTVSEDSNFASGNVTITYMVVVYSNMESSWSVSDGSEADSIEFNLEDMIVVKNSDIKVCVVGTGGAFTTSSSQADMVNAFADRSITCKRVVCYDVTHGGVNAALNYCKEVYPSASEWDIYIVGKVMANNTYSSADGFVDISSSDYAGKTINLIGLTDNTKDILDANSKCRVLNLSVNAEVKIEALTLTKGKASGNGGGIAITNGTVKLGDASIVTGNFATNGGGVYVASSGTLFMFARALIGDSATRTTAPTGYTDAANYCTGDWGGGIYNEGGKVYLGYSDYTSSMVNEECDITDGYGVIGNSDKTGGWGGGIYSTSSATTIINSGDVSFNHCMNWGGGIHGPVTITGGRIRGNTAKTGGGIYIEDGSSTMSAGEIGTKEAPNTATGSGGGVYVSNGASFTMTGGKISFNTAGVGGGVNIYWYSDSSYGTFTFQGGTISGNEASKEGGAIYNKGTLNLEGGIIGKTSDDDDWNKATGSNGKGGAIYQGGTCTMEGDIYVPFGYKERINDVYVMSPIKLTGALTKGSPSSPVMTLCPSWGSNTADYYNGLTQDTPSGDADDYIKTYYTRFGVVNRGNKDNYEVGLDTNKKGMISRRQNYKEFFLDTPYIFDGSSTLQRGTSGYSEVFIEGRTITINPMYVGKYELTQGEYEKYCTYGQGTNNEARPPNSNLNSTEDNSNYAVYGVSWYDMFVYCNLRSMAEGLDPVYTFKNGETDPRKWPDVIKNGVTGQEKYRGPADHNDDWDEIAMDKTKNGWRLPTEAEWEYIAANKNTSETLYPGTNSPGTGSDGAWGWFGLGTSGKVHKVGQCSNGVNGIMDLSGNVFEMCWDWCCIIKGSPNPTPEDGGTKENALTNSGSTAKRRVIRGGCFNYGKDQAVVTRSPDSTHIYVMNEPQSRFKNCGARLVRTYVTP